MYSQVKQSKCRLQHFTRIFMFLRGEKYIDGEVNSVSPMHLRMPGNVPKRQFLSKK